jgi:ribosomal-protein-serine acetyltransferase
MDDVQPPPGLEVPDELAGARVLLRPWQPTDAPLLFEAVDESRIRIEQWLAWIWHHTTEADSEAFCRRMADLWTERGGFPVGIWHRESGQLLGGSGLHHIEWRTPSGEIGYWLRDSAVGHGYVEEAVRLVLAFAFNGLGLVRVGLNCDPSNLRSRRIPEVLGFTLDGRLRSNQRTPSGMLRDTLVYSILADEWSAITGHEGGGHAPRERTRVLFGGRAIRL